MMLSLLLGKGKVAPWSYVVAPRGHCSWRAAARGAAAAEALAVAIWGAYDATMVYSCN